MKKWNKKLILEDKATLEKLVKEETEERSCCIMHPILDNLYDGHIETLNYLNELLKRIEKQEQEEKEHEFTQHKTNERK